MSGEFDYGARLGELLAFLDSRARLEPGNEARIADLRAPYQSGNGVPAAVIEELGALAESTLAGRQVAIHVMSRLAGSFSPAFHPASVAGGPDRPYPLPEVFTDRSSIVPLRIQEVTGDVTVVVWRYTAVHDRALSWADQPGVVYPTDRVITFDGVSLVQGDPADPSTLRTTDYIDWNFVAAQLGFHVANRPMLGSQVDAEGVISSVDIDPGPWEDPLVITDPDSL